MGRSKTYKPYNPDQLFLLPPSLKDWLPEGHLAYFAQCVGVRSSRKIARRIIVGETNCR
ncbi:MAG: hypothetical protein QME79_07915 [Bacillota bacterium]|nr:hypothetical protein [Bacillota bacterium]